MSFWLFLRIMIGLLAGKTFLREMLNNDNLDFDDLKMWLSMLVFRAILAFVSWWGLTPVLNLL